MLSSINPEIIQDLEGARTAIMALLNLVEELKGDNASLREEVQRMRDEIARLKGEQGKPEVKGSKKKEDHSSEEERRQKKKWKKREKKSEISIQREQKLEVDKSELPADAEFKGYVEVVVQDIRIEMENVKFLKEKYYSASESKTYIAELPAGHEGEFGPGVRSLVLVLYFSGNMTEPKIVEFLSHIGVRISTGQISNLLIKKKDDWNEEKREVVQAGLESTTWQHTDDTATRVDGENQHCHILCNPLYTAYFTRPGKDRLTILDVLQGGEGLRFLLNAETAAWLDLFKVPQWAQAKISQWPQESLLERVAMDGLLQEEMGRLNQQQQARILEAAALTAYNERTDIPIINTLLSDDAAQFQHTTEHQALCWIHEGRHYKKLTPFVEYHRQLLKEFGKELWQYYHQLQAYREQPSADEAVRLREEFDALFSKTTGYDALDQRIAKTYDKKERLLQVLDQPQLPLHNNPAELGARQRVRKRDISFGPRTQDGVEAWDTFMTLTETAKKLGVSFYQYVYDRVSGDNSLPSLADLIRTHTQTLNSDDAWLPP